MVYIQCKIEIWFLHEEKTWIQQGVNRSKTFAVITELFSSVLINKIYEISQYRKKLNLFSFRVYSISFSLKQDAGIK